MDIYIFILMIIIFVGSILSYVYYLKDKANQFNIINSGICPFCKEEGIELTDTRGGGCCSPKLVSFRCNKCGYENSFSIDGNCKI